MNVELDVVVVIVNVNSFILGVEQIILDHLMYRKSSFNFMPRVLKFLSNTAHSFSFLVYNVLHNENFSEEFFMILWVGKKEDKKRTNHLSRISTREVPTEINQRTRVCLLSMKLWISNDSFDVTQILSSISRFTSDLDLTLSK